MNQSVHLKVCSYLHTGATFSHALSSLPLCLVSTSAFSLPSDPPPSLGERGQQREYQIQTLSSSKRVPELLLNSILCIWVLTCGCLCSLDWTRIHSLYCWLWFLFSTAKKCWNTLYKAKRVAWGSLWFRYPKRESKRRLGADSNCIPLYPSLCSPAPTAYLSLSLFFLLSPVPHRLSVVADTCLTETERQSGKKERVTFLGVFCTAENSHQFTFISINWYYYKNQYVNTIKTFLVLLSLWPYLYMNYYYYYYLKKFLILGFGFSKSVSVSNLLRR